MSTAASMCGYRASSSWWALEDSSTSSSPSILERLTVVRLLGAADWSGAFSLSSSSRALFLRNFEACWARISAIWEFMLVVGAVVWCLLLLFFECGFAEWCFWASLWLLFGVVV